MMIRFPAFCFIVAFVFFFTQSVYSQPYWNQFRGPNSQGYLEGANPPAKFDSTTNVKWVCEIPSGYSSPVIWDDKIFLTAFDVDQNLETICISRLNGTIEWKQNAPAESVEPVHKSSNPAASTPTVDEHHVYVYFGSYGILCYDHDGNEQWKKPIPTPKAPIDQGSGVSLMTYNDHLYFVYGSTDKTSYLECIDCQTGDSVWKTPRLFATMTYATPVVWETDEHTYLVVASNGKLSFYDPETGDEQWWVTGLASSVISVPVIGENKIFCSTKVMGGFDNSYETEWSWTVILEKDKNNNGMIELDELKDGFLYPQRRHLTRDNPGFGFLVKDASKMFKNFDKNEDQILTKNEWFDYTGTFTSNNRASLIAVTPGIEGDCTESNLVWSYKRFIPEVPSILYYNDRIYIIRDGGLFVCLSAETGEALYSERVGARGQYTASPIAAGGKIYVCSVSGVVTILKAGDEFEILETNDFSEQINATPAMYGDEIYIRTAKHLYAFD